MGIGEYEAGLRAVAERVDQSDDQPIAIRNLARDIATYSDRHAELAAEATEIAGPWPMTGSDGADRLLATIHLGEQMDAMLRSAIVFGDIANARLLQAVLGTATELNVNGLTAKPEWRAWAALLDVEAYVSAHALRIYRNELVAHFGQPRTDTSSWHKHEFSGRRIMPVNFRAATTTNHDRLEAIAARNQHLPQVAAVPEVEAARHNFFELLEALFYALPPMVDGERSEDRVVVDKLVASGGVKSRTMEEVVTTLASFATSVAHTLT